MADKFFTSSSSHVVKKESISNVMWAVNAALLPAGVVSIFIFGPSSLWVILASIVSAVATETFIQKARRKRVTISDGSAFMTGLLLAYTLPPHCPLWVAFAGSFFAIAVAKQAFGGLGRNIFNPALAGRAFLVAAWPRYMTTFTKPFVYDAVTQATPLSLLKQCKVSNLADMGLNYWDLFLGNRGGSLGEVCILFLLLGGFYLLYKRIITWHIPATFILTAGVFAWIFGDQAHGFFKGDFLFYVLSGGLVLGAVYMATDYVTSPVSSKGKIAFGIGCGLLTFVIRLWGGYPEGVCYAILMMNACVPWIDRFVRQKNMGSNNKEGYDTKYAWL